MMTRRNEPRATLFALCERRNLFGEKIHIYFHAVAFRHLSGISLLISQNIQQKWQVHTDVRWEMPSRHHLTVAGQYQRWAEMQRSCLRRRKDHLKMNMS